MNLYDRDCTSCGLCEGVTNVCIPGRGPENADILLIGEAPGRDEDLADRPFVGKSGQLLMELLDEVGIGRDKVYISNLVKCRPPENRDPEPDEVIACADKYLWDEIDIVRPKVIVTVGRWPSWAVLGRQESIGDVRGVPEIVSIETDRGEFETIVVSTWHPAFALRNRFARGHIVNDLQVAKSIVEAEHIDPDYRLINDPKALTAWTDWITRKYNKGDFKYIASDIESNDVIKPKSEPQPYSSNTNLTAIQFCWEPGKAVLIPIIRKGSVFNSSLNLGVLRDCLIRIFDTIPLVGHNWKFDATYLWVKLGIPPTKKLYMDTLLAYHCLGGNPKDRSGGLDALGARWAGMFAHKQEIKSYLDQQDEETRNIGDLPDDVLLRYGCEDTDKLFRIVEPMEKALRAETYERFKGSGVEVLYKDMWESYQERYLFPWRGILEMELAGAATDQSRFPEIEKGLRDQMDAAIESVRSSRFHTEFVASTKKLNPKRKKEKKLFHWKITCKSCGDEEFVRPPKPKYKSFQCNKCGSTQLPALNRKMLGTGEFVIDYEQPEWIENPLNLNSPLQVKRLFYEVMNLPKLGAKGKEDSTDKAAKEKLSLYCVEHQLVDQLQVIKSLADYKIVDKLYTNYAKALPTFIYVKDNNDIFTGTVTDKFAPNTGTGFLHTRFFQDGTRSGRLATRTPPLHTIPKKSVIKEIFEPRFGNGFILQADYSQAEVRTLVIMSGDDDLRKVFQEGKDPHKMTASKSFFVSVEDVTPDQRQDAKSILFGLIFGRGAAAIAEQTGKTVEEMQRVIDDFYLGSPKVAAWVKAQHDFVLKEGCVVSSTGLIRNLQDDIDSEDKKLIAHAKNVSVNHPIQGLAGDFGINSVARIHYSLEDGYKSVIFLAVHDSAVIDVEGTELLSVPPLVHREMTDSLYKKYPIIDVPMDVDLEIGLNWGNMMGLSIGDSHIELDGKLAYLNPIVQRIKASWEVSAHKPLLYEDNSGSKNVRIRLDLEPLATTT